MLKMAYAPLPKLACKPINSAKMCPTELAKTTLSEVLQSEPVKRLFNQPNIIIKAIPLNVNTSTACNRNVSIEKKNGASWDVNKSKQSQMSVIPIRMMKDEVKEEDNLLPSKKEGKSEIALLPIKHEKKSCGHYEPCENIICDVTVHQYVDYDGSSLMLATNIEEDEINAPVSKHCKNEKCDALSIDHNRCRRALIKLYRYNRSKACDICGITLKTQKSRVHHKNCTRKDIYRHNDMNGAQVLKERMREREIQMLEASKSKKNDYLDPVMGHSLAMETLKKNDELIIIPKSVPVQQPTITITTVPAMQSTEPNSNAKNGFGKILPSIPIVLPQQSIVFSKTPCSNENNTLAPKQVTLCDTLNRPFITTTNSISLSQSQYVRVAPQSNSQTIAINDLVLSPSQIVTSTPIQPKPFLTPIRVVPITNLITQPSLLHRTQGIPKFCIMADNTVPSITISNPQTVQPPVTVSSVTHQEPTTVVQKKKKAVVKKKGRLKKKEFKCSYCFKCFSTDWYFRMHVAMHKGEKKFSCKVCPQSFTNRYDLKRHMKDDHKNENVPSDVPDKCNAEESFKCVDCDIIYTSEASLQHHRQKCHDKVECKFCQREFLEEELNDHVAMCTVTHDRNEESAKEMEESYEIDTNSQGFIKTEVSSSITQRKNVNNKQEGEENETNKVNGVLFIPVENNVKTVKVESNHRV